MQKRIFLSFDEIHIKPGLQYQGKYVLGNAQNKSEIVPAKNVLAVMMINPSYGAPAFLARLIPVSGLDAHFLFEIIKSMLKLIHEVVVLLASSVTIFQSTRKHSNYSMKFSEA